MNGDGDAMSEVLAAQLVDELTTAVLMTVDDPSKPFVHRLRMWSGQQEDSAEFRQLLVNGLVVISARLLTEVLGREGALALLSDELRVNLAMHLEERVFGRDVGEDGWL